MLSNRPLHESEAKKLGLMGKIHDQSSAPWGERVGVVLAHGRAGDESVMWVFSSPIEALDPIVLAPRAIVEDSIGGYSWWEVEENKEGSVTDSSQSTSTEAGWGKLFPSMRALEKAVRLMPDMYGVNPKKIIAIGFSQGGALVSLLSLDKPDLFKGVGILASFIPRIARSKCEKVEFDTLPSYFMSHGTEDRIIPFEKALETKEFLKKKAKLFHFHSDKVGHKVSSSGTKELKTWIEGLCA